MQKDTKSDSSNTATRGPKGERAKQATVDFVNKYDPTKSKFDLVKPAEWVEIAPFVRGCVAPHMWMAVHTLRPYLNAATKLGVWALRQHMPLDASYLFDADVLAAFAEDQSEGAADISGILRRLAREVLPEAEVASTPRRPYQAPYSTEELQLLIDFARANSNTNRRTTLLAILALGAGAGASRSRMRGVEASALHQHDDGRTYLRTSTNCALVNENFEELFDEVVAARPTGQLVGNVHGENLTKHAVEWVQGRIGVPELNVDRLRATYVRALIESGATLIDVMRWAGTQTFSALEQYLPYCELPAVTCATSSATSSEVGQ